MKTVIRYLRHAALLHKADGPTDSQLLEAFLSRREETAFEFLLRRHGPMVLGVCRRILRNVHDAEDAFQATFMVLAHKAGSLRSRELLGNWLYGVAYRTAMKAQAMNAKRRSKERRAGEIPRSESSRDEELLAQLDQELNRLPDRYRVPVVLCELEGRSRKEVARTLGVPEGTLSSRLAQAKKLLARRLPRYGTVAVAALLAESVGSAGLSPALRASTVKAVLSAGAVPAKVMVLTEGVLKAMFLTKLKVTACFAVLMLLTGIGATGLTYRATAQQPKPGVAQASRVQADELEALRLEIEALRKSLQATRERVKALEEEVGALKKPDGASSGRMAPPVPAGQTMPQPAGTNNPYGSQSAKPQTSPAGPSSSQQAPKDMYNRFSTKPETSAVAPADDRKDPLSEAEAALKKLCERPDDRQAAEALERALKRLRERDKPKPPTYYRSEGAK